MFPVFFMGSKAQLLRAILLATSIGAMTVASVIGLLRPALQHGGTRGVAVGLAAGGLLLLGAKALLEGRDVHDGKLQGVGVRLSFLVFSVLLVHCLGSCAHA